MNEKFELIIDDREPNDKIENLLLREFGFCRYFFKRLKLGDYVINEKFLVERKSFPDLAQSLASGRLLDQVSRLYYSHYRPILLIEGKFNDISHYKIRREAILGAIINTSVILDIPVLRSADLRESIWVMSRVAGQSTVAAEGVASRVGRRPKTLKSQQLYFLQGLPGIGPKRAKELLKAFGSINNILNASAEEFQELKGFSKSLIKKIYDFLGSE